MHHSPILRLLLHPSTFILHTFLLLLAGCESMPFKSSLRPNAGSSATFQAAPDAVFDAVLAALPRAGFTVTEKDRSRGTVQGLGDTFTGNMGIVHQSVINAYVTPADGGTAVTLRLWRIEEDRSGAYAPMLTRTPVTGGPTCDAIFAAIRAQVEPPAGKK